MNFTNASLEDWADAAPPSQDRLDRLRRKAAELRDVEHAILDAEARLAALKADRERLQSKDLPELFAAAQTDSIGLLAHGNLPECDVVLAPFYAAHISEERRPEAHAYLRKRGDSGLIKSTFSVSFGRDADKKARMFSAYLDQLGYEYERKETVHPSTLKKFVKDEVEAHRELDLAVLGATIGSRAQVRVR